MWINYQKCKRKVKEVQEQFKGKPDARSLIIAQEHVEKKLPQR